jgi:hypothetical protein
MREFEEIVTVPSTMRSALATLGQHTGRINGHSKIVDF